MKWIFIYISILLIGFLEYLPIPGLPESVIEWIQSISFFLPWIGIIALAMFRLFGRKKEAIILYILILSLPAIAPSLMREGMNRVIIFLNNGKELTNSKNIIAGTKMNRASNHVSFAWNLLPSDYEILVYKPNHKLKSDESGREIIEILNDNWYIKKTGLFE